MSNSTSLSDVFLKGGWLPISHEAHQSFLKQTHQTAKKQKQKKQQSGDNHLLPEVQDFKNFIEKDGKLLMGFQEMIRRAKITHVCNLLGFFLAFNH
jgi:hypothetical protein